MNGLADADLGSLATALSLGLTKDSVIANLKTYLAELALAAGLMIMLNCVLLVAAIAYAWYVQHGCMCPCSVTIERRHSAGLLGMRVESLSLSSCTTANGYPSFDPAVQKKCGCEGPSANYSEACRNHRLGWTCLLKTSSDCGCIGAAYNPCILSTRLGRGATPQGCNLCERVRVARLQA